MPAVRSRRALFAVLGFVIVSFAAIGAAECAFAVWYAVTGRLAAGLPDRGLGIRSWTVHHAMRPGYEGPGDPRGNLDHVRTNSFGLRDEEPQIPKPEGVYRILFLGDSFTYGWKVAREERFVDVCGAALTHRDGETIDAICGGVSSYSPMLAWLSYRHHLAVLRPDLVVIHVDMSDVQDTHWLLPYVQRDERGVALLCTEPSLGTAPRDLGSLHCLRWLRKRLAPSAAAALEDPSPTIDNGARGRYLWTLDDGPTWEAQAQATFEPIAWLADLLAHDDIPLVIATYPYPWQVSATATPERLRAQLMVGDRVHRNDRPFRMLADFAAAYDLPLVNATDHFRVHPDVDSLYFRDDLHWTPAGHRYYGLFLAAELATLIPELQPTEK